MSLHVTGADEQDRAQVGMLARDVQEQTGKSVELAYVDQGYTGDEPAEAAQEQKIKLSVVKLPEAKRGFVLLPRRWVVAAELRVARAVPPAGPGLRTARVHAPRHAPRGVRDRHAGSTGELD